MSFARGPSSLINVAIYLPIASIELIEDTEFVCYVYYHRFQLYIVYKIYDITQSPIEIFGMFSQLSHIYWII